MRMAGDVEYVKSLPVRGAWIEMALVRIADFYGVSSLPVRGAWIEIFPSWATKASSASLPVRGAWIEICPLVVQNVSKRVAPRAGSVD